jgi:hypothetical protein
MTTPFYPVYELTVYAPRSVDPTEATVLTPAAGAPHSDPFVVTSKQGIAGSKPYLAFPTGRTGAIDPLNKTTTIGALTLKLLDVRVTAGSGNAARWVTAFVGDVTGGNILIGRKYRLRQSMDGGTTFTSYSSGRITATQLDGKLWVSLTASDRTDDLTDDVFVGTPAANVASYAHQSQLYPLGLLQKYASFPLAAKARGTIAAPQVLGYDAFALEVDKNQADTKRLIAPRILVETLLQGKSVGKHRLVVTRLDTSATTEWELPRAIRWSTSLEKLAAGQLPGASAAVPPVGTAVEFYIRPTAYPISERLPLLIDDVNPVTYISDLCAGYYGRLDASGNPVRALAFNANGIDGTKMIPWRRYITKSSKRNAEIEAVCRAYHLAYFTDGAGVVNLVDLRRASTTAPAVTLTDADLETSGGALTWQQSRDSAVTSVVGMYYPEIQTPDRDLPKPFDFVASINDRPDIPPVRIQELAAQSVLVPFIGPRSSDMKPQTFKIDALGFRFVPGAVEDPEHGETYNGTALRSYVIQQALLGYADELSGPFGLGPSYIEVTCRRASANVALALQGKFVALTFTALPDPATNQRGGPRLGVCIGRTEDGPRIKLRFIDAGANSVALVPTLAATTTSGTAESPKVTQSVTLNAAGEPVRLSYAITAQTVAVRPADDDAAWTNGPLVETTASVDITTLPSTSRIWVRGRSVPRAGIGFKLPSAWAIPAGSGRVDTTSLNAPSGIAVSGANAGSTVASWTNGETWAKLDLMVVAGAAPATWLDAYRVAALDAGSIQAALGPYVTAGQQYTVGVRHRDRVGGVSAVASATFYVGGADLLDAPSNPVGFSGSQDPSYGFPRLDGIYGLAVAAAIFPGFTEFVEEVETAPNSGTYGAPASVAKVANVQGDWTLYENVAPNDGLRRVLAARSVRDNGTPSAYTTGIVVTPWTASPLGIFSQTAGVGGILRVSETESSDGKNRLFTLTLGAAVDSVHVHFRTVAFNATGDTFNFSGTETVAASPQLVILSRTNDFPAGIASFSIPHPPRGFIVAGRLVPLGAPPQFKEGVNWPLAVQPAPPAVTAHLHTARVGTTGSISIDVSGSVSDFPLGVQVIEDTLTASMTLVTTTLTAAATLDSGSFPALGNIALPLGKDTIQIRVIVTDSAGQPWPFGPAPIARDPLASGNVTVNNFRAVPAIVCGFDSPDADAIRITTHSGKVKTFNAAALASIGSPVTFNATDATDDTSSDPALVVDEVRDAYKVEYQGGGTWSQVGPSITLHGQPSNPPTADVRTIANSDRSAMDVTVRPDTQVNEKLFVYFRDGSTDTALQWIACVSAGDPTALQVVAGTLLGPANFFRRVDGVGSPTAKLSAIALGRDQLSKYGVMIKGVDSGIQSPWLDVVLSLAEQPWNESVDLRFDPATRELAVYIVAGAHVASEGVLFADNDAFSAPLTGSGNVTDGNTLKVAVTLSAAQLGKPWYAKVTPFNAASLGGLMGAPQKATVQVPAIIGDPIVTVVEAGGNATITVQIDDPGSYLNTAWTNGTITTALHFAIQKLGVGTIEAQTTHTLVGTLHTWTKVIALDLLHMINVGIFAHFIDGSTAGVWSSGVDSNKISDVVSGPSAANNGVTATVSVGWDSDTLIGSNCARYSLDNGATWTSTVTVTSALLSQFNVTRIATKQTLLVQAKNALDGAWGNQGTVEVDAYIADGPSFDVHLVEGTTTTAVYWSCTSGVATLSIDGGTAGTPPASPITVTRPAAGQKKLNYNFAFAIAGQTITDSVDVNPIDADTVTPNLTVTPGTPTATTQPYTVTFSNPKAGGAAPTATVTCAGCTMTIGGTTYVDGTTQALSTGDVVTANRPSTVTTTQAKLKFDATLAGGGSESIVAEVTLQLGLGPSLTITETLNDVSDLIAYTSTGTLTVSINGAAYGTPAASPITVNRSVLDQTYSFQCTADGQTISRSVIIPAVVAIPQGTLSIDKIAGNTASQAQWSFRVDGAANVASYRYAVSTSAEPDDTTTASTGTIANGRSFSVVNGGTIGLGTTVYVTLIPFTQASGAGSQLKSIHLRDTFTTFGSSKTVSFSSSAWNEMIGTGKVYGVVRTGSFAPQNPALEPIGAGVGTQELGMNATTPVGVKLHQVSFVCAWNSAAQPLGTFVFALYLNGVFQGSVSPAYNSGTQTKTIALSDVAVNTNNAILIYAKFTGPASGANATLAQAALGDVSLNYIMTTNDQTY